ncbi:SDR family oxidoreductase [Vibrio sp. PP-XX7]
MKTTVYTQQQKAAVETLTGIMAKEMRGRNINVNTVAPGPTATELFLKGKSDELIDRVTKMSPLERSRDSEDIASVVAFLAGPDELDQRSKYCVQAAVSSN